MLFALLFFGAFGLLPAVVSCTHGEMEAVAIAATLYVAVFAVAPVAIALLWWRTVAPDYPWVVEHSTLMRWLGLKGLAIWPVVFVEASALTVKRNPTVILLHESIHIAQQQECGVLPFYLLYIVEESCRALLFRQGYARAYFSISFEQEAYAHERKSTYLRRRRPFAWTSFLVSGGQA